MAIPRLFSNRSGILRCIVFCSTSVEVANPVFFLVATFQREGCPTQWNDQYFGSNLSMEINLFYRRKLLERLRFYWERPLKSQLYRFTKFRNILISYIRIVPTTIENSFNSVLSPITMSKLINSTCYRLMSAKMLLFFQKKKKPPVVLFWIHCLFKFCILPPI